MLKFGASLFLGLPLDRNLLTFGDHLGLFALLEISVIVEACVHFLHFGFVQCCSNWSGAAFTECFCFYCFVEDWLESNESDCLVEVGLLLVE